MLRIVFLLIFISNIYMQHFSIGIEETGESTLFIFQNTISSLDIDDEIGLFDLDGTIDSNGNEGEILVGTGIWNGQQLSVVGIMSQDLSDFGGPILPGANSGNTMMLKVWDMSTEVEYSDLDYDIASGGGSFNGLFTAISEIYLCDIPEGECDCDGNVLDECGVCGGDGAVYECGCTDILEGFCDCDGNIVDCFGECDGSAVEDECGVCNGYGAIYECGCNSIAAGECDCDGNVADDCGICGGLGTDECGTCDGSIIDLGCGCGDPEPSGCDEACGSTLEFDECGVCGGDGIEEGTCDCDGNILDCFGVCGGSANLDECGVCDGPGATYYCDWPYYYYVCNAEDCDGGTGDTGGGATGGWDGDINYESEIEPIFQTNCTECHSYGGGYAGSLDLTSYANLMEGGSSGDAIFPYYSSASLLIQKLNGIAPGAQMPPNSEQLDNEIISLIASWIDQGAVGPDDNGEGGCNTGEIEDCNGSCFDENLLENGECNDGADGGANFNCSSLYFDGDCIDNFENCNPDCPVGILEFGDVNVAMSDGMIIGELEIIMNCEFDVSEFEINLSDGSSITSLIAGTAVSNEFNINFENNLITGSQNETSLESGEQSILSLGFETSDNKICFDVSAITTSIGISYNAELGSCIPLGSYPVGWNWVSVNQFFDDMTLTSVLQQIDGSAEFIKSQSGYADYYDGFGWFGTLENIDNISMYKLRMANPDAIAFRGNEVTVSEVLISLSSGWNWIGYVPTSPLELGVALSNIPDGNAEFIKSQSGYADYYSGFGWFGTLENMSPLLGYLLRMSADTDFTYNEGGMARMSTIENISYDAYDLNIHDYEHNATMTSAVYIDDIRIDTYDYVLSAHDGTKCVGYTEGLYFPLDGNIVFPLMVYGSEAGTSLTLKVYNKLTQEYLDINEEFVFTPDMTLGDGFNPVTLNSTETPTEHSISAAYPNPFNPAVNFDIDLDGDHYVDARVYNLSGQEVAVIHDGMLFGNAQKLSWMAVNQSSGIYFIKVAVDGVMTTNNKIILLK